MFLSSFFIIIMFTLYFSLFVFIACDHISLYHHINLLFVQFRIVFIIFRLFYFNKYRQIFWSIFFPFLSLTLCYCCSLLLHSISIYFFYLSNFLLCTMATIISYETNWSAHMVDVWLCARVHHSNHSNKRKPTRISIKKKNK